MDVSEAAGESQEPKPKRVRKPTSAAKSSQLSERLTRRAEKVAGTIKELLRWRKREQSDGDLDLPGTLERDADEIGRALAATAEHFTPFGTVIDLLFGETGPLAILLALAPTVRAARSAALQRLAERRQRLEQAQAEREQEQAGYPLQHDEYADADRPGWAGDDAAVA